MGSIAMIAWAWVGVEASRDVVSRVVSVNARAVALFKSTTVVGCCLELSAGFYNKLRTLATAGVNIFTVAPC